MFLGWNSILELVKPVRDLKTVLVIDVGLPKSCLANSSVFKSGARSTEASILAMVLVKVTSTLGLLRSLELGGYWGESLSSTNLSRSDF